MSENAIYEHRSERRLQWFFGIPLLVYIAAQFSVGSAPGLEGLVNYVSIAIFVLFVGGYALRVLPLAAATLWWSVFAVWIVVAGAAVAEYWILVEGSVLRAFQMVAIVSCVAAYATSPARARLVCWTAAVFSLYPYIGRVFGVAAMARLADVDTRGMEEAGRFTGSVGQPNLLASIMVYGAMATLMAMATSGKIGKIVGACLLAVQAFATLMSGSRGGFLVLVFLVAATYGFQFIRGIRGRVWPAIAATVLISVVVYFVANSMVDSYLSRRLTSAMELFGATGGGSGSGGERIYLLKEAFAMFLSSPFFGIGMDNFRLVSGTGMYPHNNFAVVFTETGLIGAVLYFGPIVWGIMHLWRVTAPRVMMYVVDRPYFNQLLATAFAVLAYGMFQGNWRNRMAAVMWGLVFGAVICIYRRYGSGTPVQSQPTMMHPNQLAQAGEQ